MGQTTAERLLAELRTEIARADSKAAVLVGALGVIAGLLSELLAGRNWTPLQLSAPGRALWWSGTVALTLSLLALLLTVLPRFGRRRWETGAPLSYFGDIQRAARAGLLAEALTATERTPMAALALALTENSRIAVHKHQWVRAGLIAFTAGTVLVPGALLVG